MLRIVIFVGIILLGLGYGCVTILQLPEGGYGSWSIGYFTKSFTTMDSTDPYTRILFVGDIMLGRHVETILDSYGSAYVYHTLPALEVGTYAVGNFEASIPEQHTQSPSMTFNLSVDATHVPALSAYGFSHMSQANNHSMDKGHEGFVHTQNVLRESGITPFGTATGIGTSSVTYIELDTVTLALVGIHTLYTAIEDGAIQDLMDIIQPMSDIQFAYVHWGKEYELEHSKQQEALAHALIDAGFDSVIGHHPHVVQDIGLYKGVPIFYSLGNFIFDQYFSKEVQEGLLLDVSIDNQTIVYTLSGVTTIGSKSLPRLMPAYENSIFMKAIAARSDAHIYEDIRTGNITQQIQ